MEEKINGVKKILKGKSFKFGDNISTDLIAPGRYFHLRSNLPELAKHVLEDADSEFVSKVRQGDFIVAGRNFGLAIKRARPNNNKDGWCWCCFSKIFCKDFF